MAAGRDLYDAVAAVRELEARRGFFPFEVRQKREARLSEVLERAKAVFSADKERDGVVYVAVCDVCRFIEQDGPIRRELGLLSRSEGKAAWVAQRVKDTFKR